MRLALTLLVLVAACRSEILERPPGRPPRDGGPRDLFGVPITVRCVAEACETPLQACCSADSGRSGTCAISFDCAAPNRYLCDERADCGSGSAVCCYTATDGARCLGATDCMNRPASSRLCGATAECEMGESCCPIIAASNSYSVCLAGACAP